MDMCAAEASEHPGHLPRYLGAGQGRRPWWHRDGDVAGDGGDDEEGYDVFGWQLTPYKGTTFQGWAFWGVTNSPSSQQEMSQGVKWTITITDY